MQLSTAIPIVIEAIVIVIKSRGIFNKPIVPNITKQATKFGINAAQAILKDRNKIINTINIPVKTIPKDLI